MAAPASPVPVPPAVWHVATADVADGASRRRGESVASVVRVPRLRYDPVRGSWSGAAGGGGGAGVGRNLYLEYVALKKSSEGGGDGEAADEDEVDFLSVQFGSSSSSISERRRDGSYSYQTDPAAERVLRSGLLSPSRSVYVLLGCSNSQIRESTFLFRRSRSGRGDGQAALLTKIIPDLDGLERRKGVAKRVKYAGLLFSGVAAFVDLPRNAEVRELPSAVRPADGGGMDFTDGCGLMSLGAARLIKKSMGLPEVPSVVQVRYGGSVTMLDGAADGKLCKGVLLLDPSTAGGKTGERGDEVVLSFRASMLKVALARGGDFVKVMRSKLGIVDYSKRRVGKLNQQLVCLLSANVPREDLLEIQSSHLKRVESCWHDPLAALYLAAMEDQPGGRLWDRCADLVLREAGAGPVQEEGKRARMPSHFVTMSQRRNRYCNEGAKLQIHIGCSRLLFGAALPELLDDFLDEGQCLVFTESGPFVGTVVVSRSPSYCTGDVRVLEAVAPPAVAGTGRPAAAWDGLRSCVLFATRGDRPEADKMSGGDMDGDQFLVIWDGRLLRHAAALRREEAEDYDPPKPSSSSSAGAPREGEDWIGYAARFDNSMLGVVDGAFRAIAKERGVKSEEARELNRLFSSLVDKNPASLRRLEELAGSCYLSGREAASNAAEGEEEECVWEDMLERQGECASRMQRGKLIPKVEDYVRFRYFLRGSNLVQLKEGILAMSDHFESCVHPADKLKQLLDELTKRAVGSVQVLHDIESSKEDDPSCSDLDAEFAIHVSMWRQAAVEVFAAPLEDWGKKRKRILTRLEAERRRKQEQMKELNERRLAVKNRAEIRSKELTAKLAKARTRLDASRHLHNRLCKDLKDVCDELDSLSIFYIFSQKRVDLIQKKYDLQKKCKDLEDSLPQEKRACKVLQKELFFHQASVDALDDELESFLSGETERNTRLALNEDEERLRLLRQELAALKQRMAECKEKISRSRDEEEKVADSLATLKLTSPKLTSFWEGMGAIEKNEHFTRNMVSETSYLSLMRTAKEFQRWDDFWVRLGGAFVEVGADKMVRRSARLEDPTRLRMFFSCAAKAQDIIASEEMKRGQMLVEVSQRIEETNESISRTRTQITCAKKKLKAVMRDNREQLTDEEADTSTEALQSKKKRDEAKLQALKKRLKNETAEANDLMKFLGFCQEYRNAASTILDGELVGALPESRLMHVKNILKGNEATLELLKKWESLEEMSLRKEKNGYFVVPDHEFFFACQQFIEDAETFYVEHSAKIDKKMRSMNDELRRLRDEVLISVSTCKELQRKCSAKELEIKEMDAKLVPRRKKVSRMFSAERLETLERQWQDTGLEDSIDIGLRHITHSIETAKDKWYAQLSDRCDATSLKDLLAALNADVSRVCEVEANRILGFPVGNKKKGQRADRLIVYEKRAELQTVLSGSDVVVVTAGTGCGKSTQLPQYIADDFYTHSGKGSNNRTCARVCCTQPRRVAAQGVASRVATEYQTKLGDLVGYRVGLRGNNVDEARQVSAKTRIEFVTEGWLLYHLTKSPSSIANYDCIIVDEAHERNKETDLLLALLRRRLREADVPPLKVVVMSASIDPRKFCEYFGDCPTIDCPGKMYEVREAYRPPLSVESGEKQGCSTISSDHVVRVLFDDILEKFGSHENFEEGDCLVFLSGSKQIEECVEKINTLQKKKKLAVAVYPLYAQMEQKDQQAATDKNHRSGVDGLLSNVTNKYVRKVICCTNIAETSLTIDGVRFVLEGGHAKQLRYDHTIRCKGLKEERISKASAKQRRGRAGRIESGWCFYLYSSDTHENMREYDKPQILETAVDELILYSLDVCGESIEHLGLLDCPTNSDIAVAKERLSDLGMVTVDKDQRATLTADGKLACRLSSIEPEGVRMVLAAQDPKLNCFQRALKLAVLISSPDDIFFSGTKRKDEEEEPVKTHGQGDHLLALECFEEFEKRKQTKKGGEKALRVWCKKNGYIYHAMSRMQATVENCYLDMKKRKRLTNVKTQKRKMGDDERLLRACVAGYFLQTAECVDPKFPKDAGFAMITPSQQLASIRLKVAKESCLSNIVDAEQLEETCWIDEEMGDDCFHADGLSIRFVLFGSLLGIQTTRGQLVLIENGSLIDGRWIVEHAPQCFLDRVCFDPDKPSKCREEIRYVGRSLLKKTDEWIRQNGKENVLVKILWNLHQIRLYGNQEDISRVKQSIQTEIEDTRNALISADSAFYYSNSKKVPFNQQTSTEFGCGLTLVQVRKRQRNDDVSGLNNWIGWSFSPSDFNAVGKYWNVKQKGHKLTIFVNRGWDSDMFLQVLRRAVIDTSNESPEDAYNFKIFNARIEVELLHPSARTSAGELSNKLSTCDFLSPETVGMEALPASVLSDPNSKGMDYFSDHLWSGLWKSLRSEWASSNPFWQNFCSCIEARIPGPVNIAYVPSRSAFEIYAARDDIASKAKDLLLQQLVSMCDSTNCLKWHPNINKYTRWKLWRITSFLKEIRLKYRSICFSLYLTTNTDDTTTEGEGTDDCWPQAFGYSEFERVEELFENDEKVMDLYVLLQTSESAKDLRAANKMLADELKFGKPDANLRFERRGKKGEFSTVGVQQTPSPQFCCMCRRQVLEQNALKREKNAGKSNQASDSLHGWRLTLCGCIFCRSCFVNSISMALKINAEAQCQQCNTSVLARDCLNIVKPRQLLKNGNETFEKDWKMLSFYSTYNYCTSMVDMRGVREECAVCDDCQTVTVYRPNKPFFACRNPSCPNVMCVECQYVPLTEEAFELCKNKQCFALVE